MRITSERRKQLSIASTEEELLQLARTVECGGEIGFPILLVPFGGNEADEIFVPDEATLIDIGDGVLKKGIFGYVHIFKSRQLLKP